MEPITTELRELAQDMNWTEIIDHIHARNVLDCDWLDSWHKAFDARCDAIDAVHAQLEQENDELGKRLGERVLNNKVIVNVKMRIDWESMAEELERAADAIRALAGDDE